MTVGDFEDDDTEVALAPPLGEHDDTPRVPPVVTRESTVPPRLPAPPPRVPTLMFYGAPTDAIRSDIPPPPPAPPSPFVHVSEEQRDTRKLPVEELSNSEVELVDADRDKDVELIDSIPAGALPHRKWLFRAMVLRKAVGFATLALVGGLGFLAGQRTATSNAPDPLVQPLPPAPLLSAGELPRSERLDTTPAAGPCTVRGEPIRLYPSAFVPAGVELAKMGEHAAIGFATSQSEGLVLRVNPTSLGATLSSTRLVSTEPVRRVVPLPAAAGLLDAAADTSQGRVFFDAAQGAPFRVDVARKELAITWTATGENRRLWPVDAADAVRVVPMNEGFAVAFRSPGGRIEVGFLGADLAPRGELARSADVGREAGSPTLAVAGDDLVVAWADRASSRDPWRLRWAHVKPGQRSLEGRSLLLSPGGLGVHAMSPGVEALGRNRVLLTWTEGPVSRHQVRAQVFDLDGEPVSEPLSVSEGAANAGQGQPFLSPTGAGFIAFLARATPGDRGYALFATPLACTP